jgi:hypothetical protein
MFKSFVDDLSLTAPLVATTFMLVFGELQHTQHLESTYWLHDGNDRASGRERSKAPVLIDGMGDCHSRMGFGI